MYKNFTHYSQTAIIILAVIFSVSNLKASEKKHGDAPYTGHQIDRGQRLFYGLAVFESGKHNCQSCHYTQVPKEVNWNPSAVDLADKALKTKDYNLKKVMDNPSSKVMRKAHEKIKITEEEAELLKAYFYKVEQKGLEPSKPFPKNLLIFLTTGILMALAIIDLLFTHKIRFKAIPVLILLISLAFHIKVIANEAIMLSRTPGYQPDQPIKFSHKVHAGQNNIDCEYCHSSVNDSKVAGIPSNQLCMNCHNVVREGSRTGKFEIAKIHEAVNNNKPIEWIKVHNLPDHVFFSHAQHVNAGKVECQTCHGEVEEMHMVRQVKDLSMGWCINCHRDTKVQFLENDYYSTYHSLRKALETGKKDSITVEDIGGENCMKCHY
ncbi:MAG: cytochrome c family protein [Bacteroidales bacterium]|nr:cytochrome c family protein [Bacteroidales bacterium]